MWFKWLLMTLFALSALITVMQIGEEREPVSRTTAASSVVMAGLLIWGIAVYF
jgi:hypothetical protein